MRASFVNAATVALRSARHLPLALMAVAAACASAGDGHVGAGATARRIEPSALDNVRWDPVTQRLGCVGGAELTLPKQLSDRVKVIARDLVMVVVPQAQSALMVTISPSFLRGKRAGILGDLPELWKELHSQATGIDLRDGDFQTEIRTVKGRIVAEYSYEPPPPLYGTSRLDFDPPLDRWIGTHFDLGRLPQWQLVYVEAGRCRIAAVDHAGTPEASRLTPLLHTLQIPRDLMPP